MWYCVCFLTLIYLHIISFDKKRENKADRISRMYKKNIANRVQMRILSNFYVFALVINIFIASAFPNIHFFSIIYTLVLFAAYTHLPLLLNSKVYTIIFPSNKRCVYSSKFFTSYISMVALIMLTLSITLHEWQLFDLIYVE